MMEEPRKTWLENRTIIIAWLVFFFPIGLYAVWKSSIFDDNQRKTITVVVLIVSVGFLFFGLRSFRDILFVFILCPGAIYLLWNDSSVKKTTTYLFCGAMVVVFVTYFNGYVGGGGGEPAYNSDCVAVLEKGGCTYYRDANCVVIQTTCG
ncbi:MAG: hypothetical protein OCD03_12930 [Hyphomicrobiales bacterium]